MGMFDRKKSTPTHRWFTYGTVNHILKVYGDFESDGKAMGKGNEIRDWDSDFRTILLPTNNLLKAKRIIATMSQSGAFNVRTSGLFRGR